jgi:hypothetical protein
MPSPDALGPSGRFIEIDLTAAVFPLLFRPLFAAKYPADPTFAAQAVSRTVVAVTGGGTITFIESCSDADGAPIESDMTFAEGGYRSIQAVGIDDPGDVELVQVML